ncbi:MAG: DUF6159 family protein [Polyangiaceae bacterium]
MNVWSRSWALTRASFAVIGADKEMLWFPLLAGFFSIVFSIAMIVPTFVVELLPPDLAQPLRIVAIFASYFGLAFFATFFNTCVVYTTKVRLSGGDATFFESIKFALTRLHLILGWSLVSASVGLLLHFLDQLAERSGIVGKILLSILRAILASAWSILTVFVIPAMVYRGLGPIDAIRDSAQTLRQTWGESLIRYYGMGLAAFVCTLPFIALFFLAGWIGVAQIAIPLVVIGVVGFLTVSLLFSLASTVFNTALYHFATTGMPQGFDEALLRGVFQPRD